MKLPVTKMLNEKEWICFEESDIRNACKNVGCDSEMIDDCIEGMKAKDYQCTTCFVELCNTKGVNLKYRAINNTTPPSEEDIP